MPDRGISASDLHKDGCRNERNDYLNNKEVIGERCQKSQNANDRQQNTFGSLSSGVLILKPQRGKDQRRNKTPVMGSAGKQDNKWFSGI